MSKVEKEYKAGGRAGCAVAPKEFPKEDSVELEDNHIHVIVKINGHEELLCMEVDPKDYVAGIYGEFVKRIKTVAKLLTDE